MRVLALLVLLVALAAPPADAQKEDVSPPDTVRLRFGWPLGLTGRITAQKSRARVTDGKADSSSVRLGYRLTVHAHERGRVVRFHDFELPELATATDWAAFQEQAAALMPSVVVDTTGAFVAIEGAEALRRELDRLMPSMAKLDSLGPEARAMKERLRSPELFTALAQHEWNALVGTWIDADFVVGLTYEVESEEPFPLFPGVTIPMVHQFSAVARVPCEEGATEGRCVELEAYSFPDADAVRALLTRIMEQLGPRGAADMAALDSLDVETEIRLIAEPETLIPYWLEVSKRVTVRMKAVRGEPEEMRQTEIKTARYEYPSRRP